MKYDIEHFKLPRYHELPTVGLYLEQTITYINDCLAPLGDITVTSSMISNYVKKGYIERPIKKQYYAEQIARLLFLVVAKQVLPMPHIVALFQLQRQTYTPEVAYNYYCREFETMLYSLFGLPYQPSELEADATFAKKMLRSVIIAVSHMIYVNHCFEDKAFQAECDE
ncbi:MAG: DUF1836 domain-containing protein [Lachnospiraceae bacterium]|nr:DUF1836 domain-containing protein [Lachnospiraceae bacterium]